MEWVFWEVGGHGVASPGGGKVEVACGLRMHPAKSLQSCPTLFNPLDCGQRVSSVHGGLRANQTKNQLCGEEQIQWAREVKGGGPGVSGTSPFDAGDCELVVNPYGPVGGCWADSTAEVTQNTRMKGRPLPQVLH